MRGKYYFIQRHKLIQNRYLYDHKDAILIALYSRRLFYNHTNMHLIAHMYKLSIRWQHALIFQLSIVALHGFIVLNAFLISHIDSDYISDSVWVLPSRHNDALTRSTKPRMTSYTNIYSEEQETTHLHTLHLHYSDCTFLFLSARLLRAYTKLYLLHTRYCVFKTSVSE